MKTKSSPAPHQAFTLLELVVVLTMLGFLVVVTVPGLAKGSPNSKTLQCLNNLRQIAAAMAQYTQDNNDLFPPNPDDGTITPGYNWCAGMAGIGGADEFNPDLIADPQRTLLAPYTAKQVNLFSCPADTRVGLYDGTGLYPDSPLKGQKIRAARSVSLNMAVGTIDPCFANGFGHCGKPTIATWGPWLTGSHGGNNGNYATFGSSGSFQAITPKQVFLMADEAIFSINDGGLATCANLSNPRFIDYPSSRHDRGGTFSFCDGHVELHKWRGTAILLDSPQFTSHTISSAGDSADFVWLATHSSVKLK